MRWHICRAAWAWAAFGTLATAATVGAEVATGGSETTAIVLTAGGGIATALATVFINVLNKAVTNGIPFVVRIDPRSRATVERLAKALVEDDEDATIPSEDAPAPRARRGAR